MSSPVGKDLQQTRGSYVMPFHEKMGYKCQRSHPAAKGLLNRPSRITTNLHMSSVAIGRRVGSPRHSPTWGLTSLADMTDLI
ncbi:hypothetical protein IC582_006059 [Cucumis melo]